MSTKSQYLKVLIFALLATSQLSLYAQGVVGIKSNLLYGALCFAPNLGVEVGITSQQTIDVSVGYNGWNRCGSSTDNSKLAHLLIEAEVRHYLCERFNGHFFGLHGIYGVYNISEHNLPWLLGSGSGDYRFEGYGVGAGVAYGYQLPLSRRWNMEFEIGVGYIRMGYDKYKSCKCATELGHYTRNYFGPTRAGVSIVYTL
ncbi:MAG: DUF3575 domain-containing protein [Rikenellaceae bacterium]